MRIGIIGAGSIGRAVTRLAIAVGHDVMISNSRGPDTLSKIPQCIGAKIGTVQEASDFSGIILIAIPLRQYASIPAELLRDKIVMDANNYYPDRDGPIPALDERRATTSGLLAKHLPNSRIVKVFNAILASDLEKGGQRLPSGNRRALPIAGNDDAAKESVATLVRQFGFDVLDAGSLTESWRFERAKPAYCIPFDREGLRQALAEAQRDIDMPEGSWRR
ncbi:NADPH-dependent F420 reductase [Chromohalobacter nigrandesensis]|uniref:NADPH-dependent F420 reductase n=1 Tax=Chromohalobacter nigrandesensis TaxID=119863 RepID=UPI001FF4E54E|nr:NAD(P)-binding domain-containing protein [Chromohalobacter nigrandesensis]MCK0746261.1 NAD(P)-binding domain-containing protein [Chromohalobacter nigrandesensis]